MEEAEDDGDPAARTLGDKKFWNKLSPNARALVRPGFDEDAVRLKSGDECEPWRTAKTSGCAVLQVGAMKMATKKAQKAHKKERLCLFVALDSAFFLAPRLVWKPF